MEREATAEDSLILAVLPRPRVSQSDMGCDGHQLTPHRIVLACAAKWCSGCAAASKDILLFGQHALVPLAELGHHAAVDEIRAACEPGGPVARIDPDVAGHPGGIVGVEVGSAILEAHQVATGSIGWVGREFIEARLCPAQRRATGGESCQRAQGMLGYEPRLGAALHAEVAIRGSGVERIAGEGWKVDECCGTQAGQPKAAVKQRRPEANGDGQAVGALAECLTRVGGSLIRRARVWQW